MYKKISVLLLLLLPFAGLSEPLLTCRPESAIKTYFYPAIGFVVLLLIFLAITIYVIPDSSSRGARVSKWVWCFVVVGDVVVIWLGVLLASYTLHLTPDNTAVINADVLMSAPGVQKGLHYQDECLVIRRSDTDVELRCSPDAVVEIVPQDDFDRAIKALKDARALQWDLLRQAGEKNICRTPAPQTSH